MRTFEITFKDGKTANVKSTYITDILMLLTNYECIDDLKDWREINGLLD